MLKVHELTKYYGSQCALNCISFEAPKGQILGFLGPNGAGKSTLMRILTGFMKADQGYCTVAGHRSDHTNPAWRQSLGYLPEHNPLYTDMYVREFLTFTARIYQLNNISKTVNALIERTGLGPEQNKKISQLSKGYRQRVGLAQAIIHDPEVLILDEPTTGLDPNQIVQIRNLIKDLGSEKTVMLSTHIMQEVEALCNRVIVINTGQLIADRPVSDLQFSDTVSLDIQLKDSVKDSFWNELTPLISFSSKDEHGFTWILELPKNSDAEASVFKYISSKSAVLTRLDRKEISMEQWFRSQTGTAKF